MEILELERFSGFVFQEHAEVAASSRDPLDSFNIDGMFKTRFVDFLVQIEITRINAQLEPTEVLSPIHSVRASSRSFE